MAQHGLERSERRARIHQVGTQHDVPRAMDAGRELVGDVFDDLQLQRALQVLAQELGVKLGDIDGLAFVPAMLETSDKKAAEAATR